jgi:dTDP-4-amino-4,6-dideoxygalactose transaminase
MSVDPAAASAVQPVQPLFPFLDLKAQFAAIRKEVSAAVMQVLAAQQFIMGPEVSALEEEIKPVVGCQYPIACASGSDALLLALMALDIGPGDEVITVPFTFVATAGCIARLGARPVFIDIDPHSYNLDPAQLDRAITKHTKAIIPIHLFGLPADMDPILEIAARQNIPVIEDAAQAIGAKYKGKPVGSMGRAGCFSFFPSKNLGGAGDGGLVATNDAAFADRLKLLHLHGGRNKYNYDIIGMNSRLDALQAAVLRVKLRHLDEWTTKRQENAQRYCSMFEEYGLADHLQAPSVAPDCVHVWNQFTIRVRKRDELKDYLRCQGIPTEIYYPLPLHLQPAFSKWNYNRGDLPQSELVSGEVLSLPIYPELTQSQQRAVVTAIGNWVSSR